MNIFCTKLKCLTNKETNKELIKTNKEILNLKNSFKSYILRNSMTTESTEPCDYQFMFLCFIRHIH